MMRLKHVAKMAAGGTPSVDDPAMWAEGGLPWVAITDMTRSSSVVATARTVTAEGIASKRLPVGDPGTLLFAMYASLGSMAVLGTRATWNQAVLGIEPKSGMAESRFIRYWLEHLGRDLGALARSNTQDNLNAEQVGNFPFPVIRLPRQQAIADYLDAETARIDAIIDKKRQISMLASERLSSAAEVALESSERVALKRVANLLPGYTFPSDHFGPEDSGLRLLRGVNVGVGSLRWDDAVHLIDDGGEYGRYLLEEGDVVIGMDRPFI